MMKEIKKLFESMQKLAASAVKEYTPDVDYLISSNITDFNEIERTLDGLLDFCFDEKMLLLFKKLCKYYYGLNPYGAAEYVNFYREQYDENYS
jgi:hypothetical protein